MARAALFLQNIDWTCDRQLFDASLNLSYHLAEAHNRLWDAELVRWFPHFKQEKP